MTDSSDATHAPPVHTESERRTSEPCLVPKATDGVFIVEEASERHDVTAIMNALPDLARSEQIGVVCRLIDTVRDRLKNKETTARVYCESFELLQDAWRYVQMIKPQRGLVFEFYQTLPPWFEVVGVVVSVPEQRRSVDVYVAWDKLRPVVGSPAVAVSSTDDTNSRSDRGLSSTGQQADQRNSWYTACRKGIPLDDFLASTHANSAAPRWQRSCRDGYRVVEMLRALIPDISRFCEQLEKAHDDALIAANGSRQLVTICCKTPVVLDAAVKIMSELTEHGGDSIRYNVCGDWDWIVFGLRGHTTSIVEMVRTAPELGERSTLAAAEVYLHWHTTEQHDKQTADTAAPSAQINNERC